MSTGRGDVDAAVAGLRARWGAAAPGVVGALALAPAPAETEESRAWSRDLRQRGFSFVGPTIVYAHMQATGMVNDHLVACFRHREVARHSGMPTRRARPRRA